MTRRYTVNLPLTVSLTEGSYTQGETFEHEFSEADELVNLTEPPGAPLLTVAPTTYLVVGAQPVYDTAPGETFSASLSMAHERMLVEGGHIEPQQDPEPAEPERKPRRRTALQPPKE